MGMFVLVIFFLCDTVLVLFLSVCFAWHVDLFVIGGCSWCFCDKQFAPLCVSVVRGDLLFLSRLLLSV